MSSKSKSISFNLYPEIKILHTWIYAHQQARRGTWHIEAVDRMRFRRRVQLVKEKLDPVLLRHLSKIKDN